MYAGRIVETASAAALYARPRHPYTRGLLESVPRLDEHTGKRLVAIDGQPPDLARLPDGCAFAARCQRAEPSCRAGRPPLAAVAEHHLSACFLNA
jgi:oligopeptide transport system ATP-binding protein